MSAEAAVYVVVRGRVQGVGFRDYVAAGARRLKLSGYVRNFADHRSVEVVAEGPRDALEGLIRHLNEGPGTARVERVDVEWRDATEEFHRVETRY